MSKSGANRQAIAVGRNVRMSLARRWVVDFLAFAKKVPSIPVVRSMNIQPLVIERNRCEKRVSWVAIFTKAFAMVARDVPQLRRAYLGLCVPRVYEHPFSVASIAVEREFDGETSVMSARISAPEGLCLTRPTTHLIKFKHADVHRVSAYREVLRLSRMPLPLRRFAWWLGLNASGYVRARQFGTFTVSVYSNLGTDSLHPISPLTSLLSFGRISPAGQVDVRLIYDHRIIDGASVARALDRLEKVLLTDVVTELQSLGTVSVTKLAA